MPHTDEPGRFSLLDAVGLAGASYAVEGARLHNEAVFLKLAGVDDRNAAEKLVGNVLTIPPEKALPLDEDEYYFRDLLDMAVATEDGEELGVLVNIIETGANDVYVVRPAGASDYKADILIPAVRHCVLDVSVADKRMTVRLMDGLR
jgi:16S rRNA processing protein RimM